MSKKRKKKIQSFTADYRDAYGKDAKNPVIEEENDIEIDDFLPESDNNDDEELLTKWDGELESEDEEQDKQVESLGERPRHRRRYGVAAGVIVLILALLGVCFIAGSIGKKIYLAATDDTKLRQYDELLSTVVMQDPKPFESPDKANEEFVMIASLWKTITANNGTNYTNYDDMGRIMVPLGDVVESCHILFGPDCQLQPKKPAQETFFEYNAEENQFHVAMYSSDSYFTPYTESAKKEGDSTILRVGYVSPSDEWRTQTSSAVSAPKPTKYMEYVMKLNPKTKQEYIYSVKEIKKE